MTKKDDEDLRLHRSLVKVMLNSILEDGKWLKTRIHQLQIEDLIALLKHIVKCDTQMDKVIERLKEIENKQISRDKHYGNVIAINSRPGQR